MANTFAPNGFQQYQGTGSSPTYEQTQLAIASTNTTPIYFGDPVIQATGTTGLGTGYITQAAAQVTYSITGGTLTAGVMALAGTFTTAIPVGAWIVAYGFTSTAATVNGAWQVTASTTSAVSFPFSGAFTTGTGSIAVFIPVAGVFVGCRYLSTANKYPVWRNYWPGSDANGDVTAYVITDPNAQFSVMTGNSNTTATAVGLANIGQNIGFNYSQSGVTTTNGVAASGLSTYFADQYTLTGNAATPNNPAGAAANNYLPFRILALQNYVPGATSPLVSINGNDNTTAYNRIVVGFNNSMPRGFAGI
jgi:hypothetical protein